MLWVFVIGLYHITYVYSDKKRTADISQYNAGDLQCVVKFYEMFRNVTNVWLIN